MTYSNAIEKINSLLRFGSCPGLERISKLLELLGNPQDYLEFVHVAGTNGKGSTCNMLASVLTSASYKTGLFTSPFILNFRERIQIDNNMISEEDLTALTSKVFPFVEQMASNGEIITEFELITAIAFLYFYEQKCDIVVLETGLGGNFDATNVINTTLVSVITSISLDHTAVLGDTLELITAEKCGIIKPSKETVFYKQDDCVNQIVINSCNKKSNALHFANNTVLEIVSTSIFGTEFLYNNTLIKMSFIGAHQISNAKTALTTLNVLNRLGFKTTTQNIVDGFAKLYVPARLELLSTSPIIFLDGSHNPDGLKYLSKTIKEYLPNKKILCLIGMLKDKDSITSLDYLQGLFSKVITLTPDNPRALDCHKLLENASDYFDDITAFDNKQDAIKYAMSISNEFDAIIICGSLYLASELRPLILNYIK